jgi:ATP-dependent helicase/nuclease subunit A
VTVITDLKNTYAAPTTDAAARARILADLDTNMLVEAGAGSGKTTSLVGRMHALVVRGEPVERIAAVTFTRKAAGELRERFQIRLEAGLRGADPDSEEWRRCDRALRELDRAFLGTIHSFCARILREHPLEVALDPNFTEVSEDDWEQLIRKFWNRWLEQCNRRSDTALTDLRSLGVDPRSLYDGFKAVMLYQDVDFPLSETASPDGTRCRAELEKLIERADALLPAEDPPDGPDGLMSLIRTLEYLRGSTDWNRIDAFCGALACITRSKCAVVQRRWSGEREGRANAKLLSDDFLALLDGDIAALLTCWREHRYPVVMRFLKRAAAEFSAERHRTGTLGFEDLLLLSARLLRENPRVRDALGVRYRRLLIDEFQDTDPIQAEVCFLLASESSEGSDWRRVTPRPGGMFLVGDPKQSIYRFRRADIQVYEFAKERMNRCGAVLALTSNFRSVAPIRDFVNRYFQDAFPAVATDVQAAFSPMQTPDEAGPSDGVTQYWVRPTENNNDSIVDTDAAQIASWIAARVATGECVASDFMILTTRRPWIATYARALGERNIAVTTSGARLQRSTELKELLVLLRAIADPDNPVLIAAALEGLFFGCSPADLYDARVAGLHFSMAHSPDTGDAIVARALRQLHEWWMFSQDRPPDALVERIMADTGLLYLAAGKPLGDSGAGALLRVVEVLRAASMNGAPGVADAVEHVEALLSQESDDAPLRGGSTDAVRVMNLHKAKGLEARVVILAEPIATRVHEPTVHVVRGDSGVTGGGMLIVDGETLVAQPVGWAGMETVEIGFAKAEQQRLLYVAATRARQELTVARCQRPQSRSAKEAPRDTSLWSPFGTVLSQLDRTTDMVTTAAPGRRRAEHDAAYIATAIAAAGSAIQSASIASITRRAVTQSAREEWDVARAHDSTPDNGRGAAWGRAVHRCIEAAGHGRAGASLTAFVAAVADEEQLNDDQAAEIERLVEKVLRSEAWSRLTANNDARFELPVMQLARDTPTPTLIEGVIDATALADGKWLLVDWKTDSVGDAEWRERLAQYTRQVATYERILRDLSGQSVQSVIHRVRTREPDA